MQLLNGKCLNLCIINVHDRSKTHTLLHKRPVSIEFFLFHVSHCMMSWTCCSNLISIYLMLDYKLSGAGYKLVWHPTSQNVCSITAARTIRNLYVALVESSVKITLFRIRSVLPLSGEAGRVPCFQELNPWLQVDWVISESSLWNARGHN